MSDKKQPLAEILERIEGFAKRHPGERLEADLARDAVVDAGRQLHFLAGKVRLARRKRKRLRDDAARLLDALTHSPAPRWPMPETPDLLEPLADNYRRLKNEAFPAFASRLCAAAGRGEPRDFALVLCDTILRRGERILVEGLILHPTAGRPALIERVRPLLGGQLVKVLARRAGHRMSPEIGQLADQLIRLSLTLIDGMLHTFPAVRFYWPAIGTVYDAAKHERTPGKAEPAGERFVRFPLFPGLAFADGPRLVERAVVATRKPEEKHRGLTKAL
ncbi:MAG: hypothetical protein K2W96_17755 [Gemmataceae bacterium]|nr:hypothetical protein [Gemmataceae bacterium]